MLWSGFSSLLQALAEEQETEIRRAWSLLITWWHKGDWESSELRTVSCICSRDGRDVSSHGITFPALQRVAKDPEGPEGMCGEKPVITVSWTFSCTPNKHQKSTPALPVLIHFQTPCLALMRGLYYQFNSLQYHHLKLPMWYQLNVSP